MGHVLQHMCLLVHLLTSKELGHELVVQVVPTIEDHTLEAQSLGKVLHCLCLASTSRACGGAPQVHAEGPAQGHVAAVGHGGDHQAGLGSQVFIPIHKACIHLIQQDCQVVQPPCLPEFVGTWWS